MEQLQQPQPLQEPPRAKKRKAEDSSSECSTSSKSVVLDIQEIPYVIQPEIKTEVVEEAQEEVVLLITSNDQETTATIPEADLAEKVVEIKEETDKTVEEEPNIEGFEGWTKNMIRDFVVCMDVTRKKLSLLKEKDPGTYFCQCTMLAS